MSNKFQKTKTASHFISRLPIHRNLNESQYNLLILQPIWHDWLKHADQLEKLSDHCRSNSQISRFDKGTLTIDCVNSIDASQLKHRQESLINFFNDELTKRQKRSNNIALNIAPQAQKLSFAINKLNVRIQLNQKNANNISKHNELKSNIVNNNTQNFKANQNSIDALNSCIKNIKHEGLADSLKKLSQTLTKNKS